MQFNMAITMMTSLFKMQPKDAHSNGGLVDLTSKQDKNQQDTRYIRRISSPASKINKRK